MQKPTKRFLSMLVALALLVAMIPASVFAEGETDIFSGWSLTLGDNIGVNFYLAEEAANYTVNTTVAGNAAEYTAATTDGYYVVTVNVAAAQMTDTITLNVNNGDESVHSGTYTVRQYAETILGGAYDDYVKDMVKEMLNYGTAAQTYFGHNTDSLADAGYDVAATALPETVTELVAEGAINGVAFYGASLVFNSKVAVRFYFTGDVSSCTFSEGTPVQKNGMYYVEVAGINPQDLDQQIELTVTAGEDAITVKYSPLNYIVRKYNNANSSDELKALVQALYGYHVEAQYYSSVIPVGALSAHGVNTWSTDGIYASTAAHNAHYNSDWSVEYKPVSADVIKLVRGGETTSVGQPASGTLVVYSDTEMYLKTAAWTIQGDVLPLVDQDYLIVEGRFTHEASGNTIYVDKTYIYNNGGTLEFSTETPTLPTTIDAGVMTQHSVNGWASNGVYGVMAENAAPYDGWSVEYTPVAAENLKLIRGGETYDIGIPGRGTLVKYSATEYFLKMEWNVGDYAPMQDGDILIVEGGYVNEASKVTLNISKTYIYANGSDVEFSTEMPTLPTIIDAGVMNSHSNGWNADALYFSMAENEAPIGDGIRYIPEAESNIQLIRDGVTYNVGHTARETIVKSSDTAYYIALWVLGDYKPLVENDILVVEGSFTNAANKTTLNISKSYILINADGTAEFSTEMPTLSTIIDAGMMSEHEDGTVEEIYFTLSDNEVPVDEELSYPYAGSVSLVCDGSTTAVSANIYKLDEGCYYLELDGVELADNDYLIVEGAFANADNGYTMNITKTYVLVDGENLVYSETEPVLETEYALTGLTNHSNGWTADGIYISHNAHEATYNSDWSIEYKPVSSDVIKLVRDGVTTSIGQPASGTLVVCSATNMFLKTKSWTIQGSVLPFVDGDQIIIEGKFKHEASGNVLVVEKTVICVDGDSLIFNPIFAGSLSEHSKGIDGTDGIYATMAANSAPYNGWSIEYTPVTADAYYVIRDGEQINIGIPGRGTLVKYSATEYYLKLTQWCTDNFAFTTDDIFVIDGFWKNDAQGVIMKMEKTYLYYDGSAWVFSTTLPTVVNAGVMKTHGNGMSGNGIYFTMDSNAAPYNGDWSMEYTQTSVDGIKLIRDGETVSMGIVDRPLIVKYSDTDYYLKLEAWTIGSYGLNSSDPITTDDVIVVEGNFEYAADNVTLNIEKSYIYYDGTAWVCSAEAPAQKNIVDVVDLGSHGNGWTANGFYFTAAANDAPYDGWSLRYKPVSADVIKCISGDTTTNVGNTGGETIVKYSDTEYYIEGWTVGSANMVAGNTFVIEGQFYNAANDVYIDVEKTYITLNADGTISVIADSDKYINAGAMSAYTSNWFGDGIYFALSSNIAPADEDWNVRYVPNAASNIKLIRNGETVSIANTGAESIVKIADGQYWLSLESWWWSTYAPIQDGDVLVIEGTFTNASNGFTLNIDKTYVTFVSKDNDDVVFSAAASTEFGDVLLPNSADTLTIGMWNGSYHVFEDKQLQELQAAGITKIMGINTLYIGNDTDGDGSISDAEVTSWLDRVYSYGISVIIDLRDWDGSTVPGYANHPGLIGFLMHDEPCATEFDTLAALKTKFDAVMPEDLIFYVNLYPSSAAGTSLVGALNWMLGKRDYDENYVQEFLDALDIEVLSWDNYSLLSGSGIRTDYFYNFEVMAAKNKTLWYTMLSAGHSTTSTSYSTPTAEELRWQMAVAMTYGVQNIDHYTYVSHESDYSCMVEYDTWEPTDLYYDIKDVDNEYLAWDNIYMAYDWVGVAGVKAGTSSTMLDKLSNNIDLTANGLASVSASEDLLVGVFDHNGNKAYMVTNAGSAGTTAVGDGVDFSMNDATVTMTLADGDYKCVAIIDNGEISYVAVNADNTVTLNVEAYEGVFVIPVLN